MVNQAKFSPLFKWAKRDIRQLSKTGTYFTDMSHKQQLEDLTPESDLDFDLQNTLYATHGLHAFAAKCPPQLVDYALTRYSKPGELLLDPMVGSGTALVEARIHGRNSLGYDFDPLARLIAQVKSQVTDDAEIGLAAADVLVAAKQDFELMASEQAPAVTRERAMLPSFHNRDYWFQPQVATSLALLASHINAHETSAPVRDFLWVAFSSLILAKTSVANARDIIHSRHHHFAHAEVPDVFGKFAYRITRMRRLMAEFRERCQRAPHASWAEACLGDARELDLEDESIDLAFTSPPYATALDYPRAHFLAIPWMEAALGVDLVNYRSRAASYIGSQQGRLTIPLEFDPKLAQLDLVSSILAKLAETSSREAKLCHRYFVDMDKTLAEIARVLRPHRHCVIVVCPSHIRKIDIPTHEMLIEIGRYHKLKIVEKHVRTISERRRVMPYVSAFGKRMTTEYVLVFKKD